MCAVCLESWVNKDARILPCDHTFCFNCLEQIVVEEIIECPMCREEHDVPGNDIELIRKNQLHRILLDETDAIEEVLFFSVFRFSINRN